MPRFPGLTFQQPERGRRAHLDAVPRLVVALPKRASPARTARSGDDFSTLRRSTFDVGFPVSCGAIVRVALQAMCSTGGNRVRAVRLQYRAATRCKLTLAWLIVSIAGDGAGHHAHERSPVRGRPAVRRGMPRIFHRMMCVRRHAGTRARHLRRASEGLGSASVTLTRQVARLHR
jgi:hypothetical protein